MKKYSVILAVLAALFVAQVGVASALAAEVTPRGDGFKAKGRVEILAGSQALGTCTFIATGTVPSEPSNTLTTTPSITGCTTSGTSLSASAKGSWQFVMSVGTPDKATLKIPSGGLEVTYHVSGLPLDCLGTVSAAYTGPGDLWTNGHESPNLVRSTSVLNDTEIATTWSSLPPAGCYFLESKPKLSIVTPASTPLTWWDTTNETKAIVVK